MVGNKKMRKKKKRQRKDWVLTCTPTGRFTIKKM